MDCIQSGVKFAMTSQSSGLIFHGVSASIEADGTVVLDPESAALVQSQPAPFLLNDFLADESSSEEEKEKTPRSLKAWKEKMISALSDTLTKLTEEAEKNGIPEEMNPILGKVRAIVGELQSDRKVVREEAYRVLEAARMCLYFDELDLD